MVEAYIGAQPPLSISSRRVGINYNDEGGRKLMV